MPADPQARAKRIVLGLFSAFLLIIGIGVTLDSWRDYRTLGSTPLDLSVEQAVPSPHSTTNDTRWVNLSGLNSFDCSQVVEHSVNGVVDYRLYLAADSPHFRFFSVKAPTKYTCGAFPAPLPGLLKKADAGLPAWLKDKGVTVPNSIYPLMDFEVDAGPGSVKTMLVIGGVLFSAGVIFGLLYLRMRAAS